MNKESHVEDEIAKAIAEIHDNIVLISEENNEKAVGDTTPKKLVLIKSEPK